MAQLKDSIVQGSLRVTDTIYGNLIRVNDKLVTPEIYSTGDIYIRTNWNGGSTKTTVAKFSGTTLLPGTNDNNRSIGSSDTPWPTIYANKITATHVSGARDEFRLLYSTTIDLSLMVGTSDDNYGIYDSKKGAWILKSLASDSNRIWTLTGNVTGTASNVTGIVAIANGGTGASTASGARTAIENGNFLTCGTAAATTAKEITTTNDSTLTGFTLNKGVTINVKFSNTNTQNNPTLNIAGTGAKAIYYKGVRVTYLGLATGILYRLTYDGTLWQIVNEITPAFGSCTTAVGTAAKTVTINGFIPYTGALVWITFTKNNSALTPTLNINSTGAKNIYNIGLKTSTTWYHFRPGEYYLFVYDGSAYRLSGNVPLLAATLGVTALAEVTDPDTGEVTTPAVALVHGTHILTLGNTTTSTINNGMTGVIEMYNAGTKYIHITAELNTATSNRNWYLPNLNSNRYFVTHSAATALGSDTQPLKLNANGALATASTYAGGTAVTLNGTSKAASTASFYAPTGAGTSGLPLISAGSGAPSWYAGLTLAGSAAASYIATFAGTTDATSSTGSVIITGGLLVKKKLYVTTAATLASTLAVTGATTLNGAIISGGTNYGSELPTSDLNPGRIFFQTSTNEYELPDGGDEGAILVKYSSIDREVTWSNTVSTLTANTTISAGTNISAGGNINANGNITASGTITGSQVFNAVWNDYAECRKATTELPGRVLTETKTGYMELTTLRLMPGCKITSDTYGILMGKYADAKTPIAVAGRVLVYTYRNRNEYQLGDAVCSAPDGTVDIMSREEITMFPDRIIGTVSEIPTYEIWQAGSEENPRDVNVDGRIWVYVR